jgi:hypothetical protein
LTRDPRTNTTNEPLTVSGATVQPGGNSKASLKEPKLPCDDKTPKTFKYGKAAFDRKEKAIQELNGML